MEVGAKPGPGWWLASDLRWYPPELHPDVIGRWWESTATASSVVTVATQPTRAEARTTMAPSVEPTTPRPRTVPLATISRPSRPNRRPAPVARQRPRGPAAVLTRAPAASGALVATVFAAIGVLGVTVMARAQGDDRIDEPPPAATEPELRSVHELTSGMCVDLATPSGEVDLVTAVPCELDHTHEVAALLAAAGTDYDADALLAESTSGCDAALTSQGRPDAEYLILQPSEASWAEGDRRIVCLAPTSGR